MRSSCSFAAAVLSMPFIIKAAPLNKRDGVVCNKSYAGDLVLMNLVNNPPPSTIPKQTNAYIGADGRISASTNGESDAMRIQFDTCTTQGWNVDGDLYGQVKPEGDNYNCFTVTNVPDDAPISIQPCSSSNDDLLRNQWFKAEWDDQGGFHVISTGNPNDNPNARPDTSYNYYTQPAGQQNTVYIRKQGTDPRYGTSLTEFQFIGLESY